MRNICNHRNRILQSLVLGFVILTFYEYYRTTVNEIRPCAMVQNSSSHTPLGVLHGSSNTSSENIMLTVSSKNSAMEPLSLKGNLTRPSQDPTILRSSISPSSSVDSRLSASDSTTLTDPQSGGNKVVAMQRLLKSSNEVLSLNNKTTNASGLGASSKDTVRAIYSFGHDVVVQEMCPDHGKGMDLVILIASAPKNIEARTAIRLTWGHYSQRRDMNVLFVLGSTHDSKVDKLLKQEEKLYGDIIRGRYFDSYSNLTLKTISSLEWVSTYCTEVRFMLKTDDDMFINVPRLLSFIHEHESSKNVIFGRLATKWKPIRNKKSKYYVSQEQYKPNAFPDFTTGPAYLLSRDVVSKLYKAALDETYLKLEDVFITGIVAHKLGIKRCHANAFMNRRIGYNPCSIQRSISIHMVKYSEQFDLWKKLLDGKFKCK